MFNTLDKSKAYCRGLNETEDKISVLFQCGACGAGFEVTGKPGDPPPPEKWTCPLCKAEVTLTSGN